MPCGLVVKTTLQSFHGLVFSTPQQLEKFQGLSMEAIPPLHIRSKEAKKVQMNRSKVVLIYKRE